MYQYDHSAHIETNREIHFRKRHVPEYRLLYFRSGNGLFRFPESQFTPQKETLYLLSPGERENHYTAEKKTSFTYISFHAEAKLTHLEYLSHQPLEPYRTTMISLMELINTEKDPLRQNLLDTLMEIFISQTDLCSDASNSGFRSILNYINKNIQQNLSVPMLAEMANLSCSHFRKLFKSETGYSPKEYLIKKRMEFARDLIRNNDLRISEVSSMMNFTNIYQFSSQYKKYFGLSPRNDLSKFEK